METEPDLSNLSSIQDHPNPDLDTNGRKQFKWLDKVMDEISFNMKAADTVNWQKGVESNPNKWKSYIRQDVMKREPDFS